MTKMENLSTIEDLKNSLFVSYSNIVLMETRLYNGDVRDCARPTQKEIMYMYCIRSKPGCTATDLVNLLNTSKALVSQTLISMEKKGYITRTKDPEDNRRQILNVSEICLKENQSELRIIEKALEKVRSQYTQEDLVKAMNIMQSLTTNMLQQT